MRFPCRCRGCSARKSLAKHPDGYLKQPLCSCGLRKWRVDKYRMRVKSKENKLCYCGHVTSQSGRPINPHRHGCKGCFHREDKLLEMAALGRGGVQSDELSF